MLLGKRLMNVGHPTVLMAAAWREIGEDGIRYRLSFEDPAEGLASDDEQIYAAALNALKKSFVAILLNTNGPTNAFGAWVRTDQIFTAANRRELAAPVE